MAIGSKSIQPVVTIGDDDYRLTRLIEELLVRGRIHPDAWMALTYDQRDHAIRAYIAMRRKKSDEGVDMSWTDAVMEYVHDSFMRNFLLHYLSLPTKPDESVDPKTLRRPENRRYWGRPIDVSQVAQAPTCAEEDKK